MSSVDVYNNANEALKTLSNLWQAMLQLIQAVSDASASSLTVEPDLAKHQRSRKEYEELKISLHTAIAWLEKNELTKSNKQQDSKELAHSLQRHDELQKVDVYKSLNFNNQRLMLLYDRNLLLFLISLRKCLISLMLSSFKWKCFLPLHKT